MLINDSDKFIGAKKYIFRHILQRESQAAYRKTGCVDAEEINTEITENNPFDIQMEYKL